MKKHTVLIINSGGREHAPGWKIKQSPKVDKNGIHFNGMQYRKAIGIAKKIAVTLQ